jgi:hypothetical protein
MKPVKQYLNDNPKVQACDFRIFNNNIDDMSSFADYLITSTVKAIAFKNCISEEDKAFRQS